jgi:hypothetical protein
MRIERSISTLNGKAIVREGIGEGRRDNESKEKKYGCWREKRNFE